jgi:uncharacterized protein (TIGR02268 family)
VFHLGSWVVLAVVVLLGTETLAQPQGSRQWRRVERTVVLEAGSEAAPQPLRLAPHVVTTVLFDTDVALEEANMALLRPLFTRLEVHARHLLLKPAVAMPAQGAPALVVRFSDAAAPQRLVLLLSTDGGEVDAALDVVRQPATAEQLEAQVVALKERCEALEERLAAARRPPPSRGLAGALFSGALGPEGVSYSFFDIKPVERGLEAVDLAAYRSGRWLAFHMVLTNPAGEAPWGPGLARLTRLDAEGRPVGGVMETPVLLREARLPPGQKAQAVVQWELRGDSQAAAYTLEVLEASGRRSVRWPKLQL